MVLYLQDILEGMSEKSILLSRLEQDILLNPEKLTARQRRNLSYRLKARGPQLNQIIQEFELLVNNIPEDSIKENLSNEALSSLMNLLEKLLQIKDHWPIGVSEDENEVMAFRVLGNSIPKNPDRIPGKCAIFSISRTAKKEEIEFDCRLTAHFNKIKSYIDPCTPDPVCRDPDYIGAIGERIFEKREELGHPFHVSENAYFDETGVSEKGWVLRKPSMVDIDQLKWMRWMPRGLKECIKDPPLFKSRKLPIKWGKEESINGSSTPEQIEKFINWHKKMDEQPGLTPEEAKEYNEYLNRKMEELAKEEGVCLSSSDISC